MNVTVRLEEEIKTEFKSEYHKLIVNVIYTQNFINKEIQRRLKPHGISSQQYNLLRILRGQHPKPANINLLIDRMLDKMSNASRLVEKLKQKGLVEKRINKTDRRNVDVLITQKGLEMLESFEPELNEFISEFKHLDNKEASQLNALLEKMRELEKGDE